MQVITNPQFLLGCLLKLIRNPGLRKRDAELDEKREKGSMISPD